jgi:CRISPR-associated protein Cas2
MIIIVLSSCPQSLKGELSLWLFEIDTGVYVGKVSARVRERLWKRILNEIGTGRAVMVFPVHNEQGFDFRLHNCSRERVDLDGVVAIRRIVTAPKSKQEGKIHTYVRRRQKASRIVYMNANRRHVEL